MSDYNRVQIESVHLTMTGLVDGLPCRVLVDGLPALKQAWSGFTRKPLSGDPKNFVRPNTRKGRDLILKPHQLTVDVLNDIQDLIDTANSAASTLTVTVDGDLGTYVMECRPLLPDPVDFNGSEPVGGRVYDVAFKLTVESLTSYTE
jgi:hypothetical protein